MPQARFRAKLAVRRDIDRSNDENKATMPQYCAPEVSKHESASSTRWRRCKSSRYHLVSLRFAPSPRAESIAFILFRYPRGAVLEYPLEATRS